MEELSVLLVDDDKNIRQTLNVSLKVQGCAVEMAESAETAIVLLKRRNFDLVLTDFRMEGKSGLDLIKDIHGLASPPIVVLMTAYASFENAVSAIKGGAFDYLSKPFTTQQLNHLLTRVKALVELKRENERLKKSSGRNEYFKGMTSPAMTRLEDFVIKIAPTEATVLLTGESGTGKTELGHLIHDRSARAKKPYIVVNCATLTESLLESELFGYVKGAFTGATQDHIGKIELSQGGTILIDEIGELSLPAQARLLRFLQEKVIERVGGNRPITIDARIIAATNRDLNEAVASGTFREDLYYRLNIFESPLVALRYRKDDIPVLIDKLLGKSKNLPTPVLQLLLQYDWPGNVRELKNCIERIVLLSAGREINENDLPAAIQKIKFQKPLVNSGRLQTLDELNRAQIEKVLLVEPNLEKAAEILGITTVTLWRKRKEYGLP